MTNEWDQNEGREEQSSYRMPPVGKWKARAVEAALGYTSKNTPQVAVAFRFLEGECTGDIITYYGFFSDKTQEKTLEGLRHCGWTGDDLSDLSGIDANEVYIVVEHEDGQDGKAYAKVRWINSGLSGGAALANRMSPDEAKAFAASMKGAVLALKGNKAAPAAGARAPQTQNRAPARNGGSQGRAPTYQDAPPPRDGDHY